MNRRAVMRWSTVAGHIGWWVFIVATFYAGGIYWWDADRSSTMLMPRRGIWMAYTPLTDEPDDTGAFTSSLSITYDGGWNSPSTYALIAFVAVSLAALVRALAAGRVIRGAITVAVPFTSLGLLVLATPGTFDGTELKWQLTMLITLAAIAIREGWTRVLLPRLESAGTAEKSTAPG